MRTRCAPHPRWETLACEQSARSEESALCDVSLLVADESLIRAHVICTMSDSTLLQSAPDAAGRIMGAPELHRRQRGAGVQHVGPEVRQLPGLVVAQLL